MPNTQAPFGLQPVQTDGKENRVREYAKATSAALFAGDAVKMNSSGEVVVAAAGDVILGVAAEYKAASETVIAVYDDPSQLFIGQADGVFALTDVGQNINITATAGDSTLKRSKHDLDIASLGTEATKQFKILGKLKRQENEVGSFTTLVVKPNSHFYASGVAGI